jgi:hypothetical protein
VSKNYIGGVTVSMLVLSAADRGLECLLGQTEDHKIDTAEKKIRGIFLRVWD